MQPSDDLVIQIFFWTSAFLAVVEAMKATGWRVWAFGILGLVLVLIGAAWSWLKGVYPPLTGWITSIATNPQSWFLLLVLFLVLVSVTGRRRRADPGGVSSEIEAMQNALRRLSERIDSVENAPIPSSTEDHNNLKTTLFSSMKDHSGLAEKVETLEKNTVRNNGKLHEYEQYHVNTMNGLIEQLTCSLLFNSVPRLPAICSLRELTPEALAAESQKASDYWKETRSLMSDTKWAGDLRYIEQDAKNTGDRAIRDIPVSERPVGVDPQDLARFAEIKYRAETCSEFLENAKLESHTVYRSILSRMRELYQQANSPRSR
jgi:hypothetical protein